MQKTPDIFMLLSTFQHREVAKAVFFAIDRGFGWSVQRAQRFLLQGIWSIIWHLWCFIAAPFLRGRVFCCVFLEWILRCVVLTNSCSCSTFWFLYLNSVTSDLFKTEVNRGQLWVRRLSFSIWQAREPFVYSLVSLSCDWDLYSVDSFLYMFMITVANQLIKYDLSFILLLAGHLIKTSEVCCFLFMFVSTVGLTVKPGSSHSGLQK